MARRLGSDVQTNLGAPPVAALTDRRSAVCLVGVRPPLLLLAGFGGFVVVIGYLLASSLTRRNVPTFVPREAASHPRGGGGGPDTLTVDASDGGRWRLVDLDRGAVLSAEDTTGWDVALRRYQVVPSRAIADVGPTSFDRLAGRPPSGYITSSFGADTTNAAIRRWYSYSMLSHLLVPNGHVYVVKTSEGRFAKLELISYYCPGLKAGCLTLRYGFLE